jgi:hypothetical protein
MPRWFRDRAEFVVRQRVPLSQMRLARLAQRVEADFSLVEGAFDELHDLLPRAGGSSPYGDGRHGAVEFVDNIFVIPSPIRATTIVINAAWLKATPGGPHPLDLAATESITIIGNCYLSAVGTNGEDANGIVPGGVDPDYQGQGAGGAGGGTPGGGVTEGLGSPGVDQRNASNRGGWSSPLDLDPDWSEAQPQQGGNGGTTDGEDGPVVGGMSKGTCVPTEVVDWLLGRGLNGIPFGVGGCGGAGGNCDGVGVAGAGGQGGGGGGPIRLAAPRIILVDGATLQRDVTGGVGGRGGDAAAGNCGGGGGGAGGNCNGIYDVTESWEVGEEVTVTDYYWPYDGRAAGGANGAGSGDGTSGSEGSPGLGGRTYLINPVTMQFTNRD